MRLPSYSLAILLACGTAPLHAADGTIDNGANADVDANKPDQRDIIVTGQRTEYGAQSTSTATKTNSDVMDIPQALSVVSEAQIADQQLRSIADLLYFVPGATPATGEGNRDQIVLRGNGSSADFFVDGVRDDVQYFRDFYNVDRVEVLKGSNAMIFGRGGGGGIINRVLKRPSFSANNALTGAIDSYGGYRLTGDIDQPLSNDVGIRLNGLYENGQSFRHHFDLKRYAINPTVSVLVDPDTRIDLSYEHLHDRRTADRGVPANGDEPLKGFSRTFFGDPDQSFARANVNLATLAVEHQFGSHITLRNRTMFGDYDKLYQNIFPGSYNAGTGLVTLNAYNNGTRRKNLFSQTDLIWENRLGGIDQTLLFGFELGQEHSRNQRMTGTIANPLVPVSDPTVDADVIFAPRATDTHNRTRATVAAAYAQDQLKLSSAVEIVAGLRFDSFKLHVNDLRPVIGGIFSRADNLWSPRLGLIIKPAKQLSLYTSYSRSYLPQSGDQFNALTSVTQALKPERFDNIELGAKWEPIQGLLATAAIYQLDRTNTRATDPLDPSHIVLTGAERSRGLELELQRNVTDRWLISAGYSLQKATITKTTSAAPAGREVGLVPHHSFSLWNRYDFTRQFGAGLGFIARSKSYVSISNAVKLPSYARVDAALFGKLPGGIQAQLNVENLFGAHYFPTADSDNNIAPGAPRTIRGSISIHF